MAINVKKNIYNAINDTVKVLWTLYRKAVFQCVSLQCWIYIWECIQCIIFDKNLLKQYFHIVPCLVYVFNNIFWWDVKYLQEPLMLYKLYFPLKCMTLTYDEFHCSCYHNGGNNQISFPSAVNLQVPSGRNCCHPPCCPG